MASTIPSEARINSAVDALRQATARRAARAKQQPAVPQFRTLSDGSVVNSSGRVIFRPSMQPATTQKGV